MRHLINRALVPFAALAACLALGAANGGCAADPTSEDGVDDQSSAITSPRPPQFVLLAFDGSLNLDFWQESRAFAKSPKGKNAKFTYFISGTYFVPDARKTTYQAPRQAAGKSAIGFGGTADAIALRYGQLKLARDEGHEIASHANGHYDGTAWNAAEWKSEFDQFDSLIFGSAANTSGIKAADIKGFRAPLLGAGPALFTTLAARGYGYDTSRTAAPDYWPKKLGGVWNFPLAQLRIVGSGKRTLSMDYNFYYTQSNGTPDPGKAAQYEKEMYDTYMAYFQANYTGNRAPVHIGHHFSKWNGGAYWNAMRRFTERVCGLPEVRCVTNTELQKFVDTNTAHLANFQAGVFPKLSAPPSGGAVAERPKVYGPDDGVFAREAAVAHDGEEGDE